MYYIVNDHKVNYHDLYGWSCTETEAFWAMVWEWVDIRASVPYTKVMEGAVQGQAVSDQGQVPVWFPGIIIQFLLHFYYYSHYNRGTFIFHFYYK